jgi:putative ABC transport system substrate-binding protein
MKRRDLIALLGGVAAAWPVAALAQQPLMPVVGFVNSGAAEAFADRTQAFREGLAQVGYVEGRNVTVEYHWLEGQNDQLPVVMGDLIRRRVAVITTPGDNASTLAAKAATTAIPIVFGVGQDPITLGLVTDFARPDRNATGVSFFSTQINAKRLGLLHELLPNVSRVVLLLNPAVPLIAETTLRDVREAATDIGVQLQTANASTVGEIDGAFVPLAEERAEALYVAPDAFFASRRLQLVNSAARNKIPAAYGQRDYAVAGGLMSYGTNLADSFRQVGVYTGEILKGAKPADLPVVQSTKFQLVLNLKTAESLGLKIPPSLLATADEVIE